MGLVNYADEVLEQREICGSFDNTCTFRLRPRRWRQPSQETLRATLLFPDAATALYATDVFPKHSLSIAARPKKPRVATSRSPTRKRIDWGDGIRADLCADRRIDLHFQGAGARLWLLYQG